MTTTEYLRFYETQPEDRKTKVVYIYSVRNGDELGVIRWYGAWRQYAFYPTVQTIWNTDCLNEINKEIRRLMNERKVDNHP